SNQSAGVNDAISWHESIPPVVASLVNETASAEQVALQTNRPPGFPANYHRRNEAPEVVDPNVLVQLRTSTRGVPYPRAHFVSPGNRKSVGECFHVLYRKTSAAGVQDNW